MILGNLIFWLMLRQSETEAYLRVAANATWLPKYWAPLLHRDKIELQKMMNRLNTELANTKVCLRPSPFACSIILQFSFYRLFSPE